MNIFQKLTKKYHFRQRAADTAQALDGHLMSKPSKEEGSMTSHTPGPWKMKQDSCGLLTIEAKHWTVAEVESRGFAGAPAADCCLANARLMAAAPDLLEALASFPIPGLPGEADWQELAAKWWNTKASAALERTR